MKNLKSSLDNKHCNLKAPNSEVQSQSLTSNFIFFHAKSQIKSRIPNIRVQYIYFILPTYQLVSDIKIDQALHFVHNVISIAESFKSAEV